MFAEFDLEELMRVPFGLPLMWVYVLIANVVLVNMLIAMFAETYTRIKKNAEIEYRYQHYLHIFEYQHVVHHLPPPFNAPLLLWDACVACCSSTEEPLLPNTPWPHLLPTSPCPHPLPTIPCRCCTLASR